MARTVKPEEYASKRKEILDAAQRLVITRGYERLAIQDILNEIQISSGAFHHYFDSRGALLEALIQRILDEAGKPLLHIIHDPHLSAIQKLQGFFDTLDRLRIAQKTSVVALLRVWYADDNAIVRRKLDEAVFEQRAPLLAEIVRQGIQEGVFTTAYPDQAGEVILSLVQGMGSTHSKLLLSLMQERVGAADSGGAEESTSAAGSRVGATDSRVDGNGADDRWIDDIVEKIVTTHAAYLDAIERALGAPPNTLHRSDAEAVKVWMTAIRGEV